MKTIWVAAMLSLSFLITGCAPQFEKEEQIVQQTDDNKKENAIIPKYNISEDYFRTILPFKPSEARGLVAARLNTRYDIDEFEIGMIRIASETYSPTDYLFQEGQHLKKDTVQKWLRRKYTDAQAKQLKIDSKDNIGLNPLIETINGDQKKKNPIYLAHILEHNILQKKDKKVELSAVILGLALNSVYYYEDDAGNKQEVKLENTDIEKAGKEIADEVVSRVRKLEGLSDVPIIVTLFQQKPKSSISPGNFIASTVLSKGDNKIGKWQERNEVYYFFPSTDATEKQREDATRFTNFKDDVDQFFPNYTGIIGRGFYKDDQLQELTIEIPMQFSGKAEVIGFTQYITGLVMEHFPDYVSVEVSISSIRGQEALIVRDAGQEEPFVHIYH